MWCTIPFCSDFKIIIIIAASFSLNKLHANKQVAPANITIEKQTSSVYISCDFSNHSTAIRARMLNTSPRNEMTYHYSVHVSVQRIMVWFVSTIILQKMRP